MPNLTPQLLGLAIALLWLTGCSTGGSSLACPPVAAYDRQFLARAAGELQQLPPASAIEQMLADYAVMRDQARACR